MRCFSACQFWLIGLRTPLDCESTAASGSLPADPARLVTHLRDSRAASPGPLTACQPAPPRPARRTGASINRAAALRPEGRPRPLASTRQLSGARNRRQQKVKGRGGDPDRQSVARPTPEHTGRRQDRPPRPPSPSPQIPDWSVASVTPAFSPDVLRRRHDENSPACICASLFW